MVLQFQASADVGRMNLDSGQACRSKLCQVGRMPLPLQRPASQSALMDMLSSQNAWPAPAPQ